MKNLSLIVLLLVFFSCNQKGKVSQWRGDKRDGVYQETNLLKQWPETGPQLAWEFEGVGNGYGAPTVTSEKIFVNGEIDSIGYLLAFDLKGKFLWKSEYGKEWMKNFIGSRSAPTVVDDLVYVNSGMGDVTCLSADNGEKKWTLNMLEKFQGKNLRFGYSQSLLVDEDLVYCAPGGEEMNVVALNRFTGEMVWSCQAVGEISAYCSPLLISFKERKVLVTFSDNALLGIDAKSGDLLWTHKQKKGCDIHGNTPIYENGYLYYATGCGNGTVKLQLSADGTQISQVWQSKDLDNIQGGFVKIGDRLIGSGQRKRFLKSVDANTGMLLDTVNFDRGVTIYADDMLYCYNEKGEMGLIKPGIEKMRLVSSFKVEKGTNEHFAHPVIHDGILYIRHGNVLLAYSIRKEA